MAKTFGIVYATKSKMLRSIIVPDDDATLTNGNHPLAPGESMLVVSDDGNHSIETCEAHIERTTGMKPARHVCAVVDADNKVVSVICADPEVDTLPGATLRLI